MTGKHLSVVPDASPLTLWSPPQLDIIREQIAPDTTDEELGLFAEVCKRTGLDPFARQIHAIVRKDRKAKRGKRMTIQTGIDGFRLIAQRTRDYGGNDSPEWCGRDGLWTEVWLKDEPPTAARVTVWKISSPRPFTAIAHWNEYRQQWTNDDGSTLLLGLWRTMPASQLAKCAEALALRKAFPQEMAGLYTEDELGVDGRPAEAGPPPASPPVADSQVVNGMERREIADAAKAAGLTSVEASAVVLGVCGVESPAQVPRNRLGDVLVAFAEVEARRAKDSGSGETPAGGADAAPIAPSVCTDSPHDDPPEEAHAELFAPDAKPGQYEQDAS